MAKITANGKTFEVEPGERLVLALERNGIAVGHTCGGYGECTTCKVKFKSGEPDTITEAEFTRLAEDGLWGTARLSCQIEVTGDMELEALELAPDHPEWGGDPGPEPEEWVTPEAVWYPTEDLKKGE